MNTPRQTSVIFDRPGDALETAYPDHTARLAHRLADDQSDAGLFSIDQLARLATRLPDTSLEWNRGDLSIEQDPHGAPANGLTAEETIRQIGACQSWIVMKNVEQDGLYGDLLRRALAEIDPLTRRITGPMHAPQAYIFVSSRDAVTPFHMDPEHNILMQIRGEKTMTVYARSVLGAIAPEHHEAFHAGTGHRNLPYDPSFEAAAQSVHLAAGDAVYVPVKAPHRVTNGKDISISFSVTWRSRMSVNEADLYRLNRQMRRRGGHPPMPGTHRARDRAALAAFRIGTKLGYFSD